MTHGMLQQFYLPVVDLFILVLTSVLSFPYSSSVILDALHTIHEATQSHSNKSSIPSNTSSTTVRNSLAHSLPAILPLLLSVPTSTHPLSALLNPSLPPSTLHY